MFRLPYFGVRSVIVFAFVLSHHHAAKYTVSIMAAVTFKTVVFSSRDVLHYTWHKVK